MRDRIWNYIRDRVDDDRVLPHEDEIYEAFALEFDTGTDFDVVYEVMESYLGCSEIDETITVKWEGEIPWRKHSNAS